MDSSPIVYVEIPAPNIERAGSFFSSVFGWNIERSNLSGYEYWMFTTGEDSLMGGLDASKPVQEGGVLIYIKVDGIESILESIEKAGGTKVRDKFDIGGGYGFSAIFKDPNGNCIGLWCKQ